MTEALVKKLAERIKEEGGRAMLVGGFVRDELMGIPSKDIDVEVYHLSPEKLREVISEFGKVDAVGASFQVYKVGQDIDVSLPRRERKTGVGHKGFTVEGDPEMSFEEACSRRDFTICSIMKDPLTGEIVDPYHGQLDIQQEALVAISSKTFQEDSLRVLRLAQFASRFNFLIEESTLRMAQETDLSDLPKERVWMELEKLLLKSLKPSVGILALQNLGVTEKLFPSLVHYERLETAIDKAVQFSNDLSSGEKLTLFVAVLTWSSSEEVLDEIGLTSVEGYDVRKRVEELRAGASTPVQSDYEFHKLSQKLSMKLMSRLIYSFGHEKAYEFADTIERLGIEDAPVKPILQGRHLIEKGFQPSPEFGKVLAEAYDKQLRGEVTTLEEAISFAYSFLISPISIIST